MQGFSTYSFSEGCKSDHIFYFISFFVVWHFNFFAVLYCSFGFVTFSNEWVAQKAKDSSDEDRTLEGR